MISNFRPRNVHRTIDQSHLFGTLRSTLTIGVPAVSNLFFRRVLFLPAKVIRKNHGAD